LSNLGAWLKEAETNQFYPRRIVRPLAIFIVPSDRSGRIHKMLEGPACFRSWRRPRDQANLGHVKDSLAALGLWSAAAMTPL